MFKRWRRKRALSKVKNGDGSTLKPYRFYQPLSRSLFFLELADPAGRIQEYAVDVSFVSLESEADLYRDGIQVATSKLPAAFPVPGGVIEVAASTLGLTRMHLVPDGGAERVLTPHRRSAEGLRARFGHRFPLASRLLGWTAVLVLLASLTVLLPQLIAWGTRIEVVAEYLGTFTAPIELPSGANTALLIAGVVASLERALTLRNHWLIDAETWWFGD